MYDSSEEAEEAFYSAFGMANLEAMMRVWAPSPDVLCIHPGGPRLEGVAEVRRSWELIFADRIRRKFALRGRLIMGAGNYRVHVLEENISVPGTSFIAPPVLATNVYQRIRDNWYLLLHHASVAPAAVADAEVEADDDGEPPRLH